MQGFKLIKSGSGIIHVDPVRAGRVWLAISVATLWLLSVGGEADETIPESTIPDITMAFSFRSFTKLRMTSIFRQGWNIIVMSLFFHEPLPLGCFIPEPW
jgi:hypothetical protein